jgi:anti-anti-sigma factor
MNRCCPRSLNKRSPDRSSTPSSGAHASAIEGRFLRTRIEGDVLTLRLSGDLDESTAAVMRGALRQAESLPVRTVVVDAARLGYLDATGLGALVGGYRRLRDQNVRLQLIHTPRSVRRVIALVGCEAVLKAA